MSKRRFSLARVIAKLAPTAETAIAMTFLVINLEQLLWQLLFVFFAVVLPQKVFSSTDGSGCGAILNSP